MSAAKHTRGPWAVEPRGVDGDLDFGARQRDGSRALLQMHIHAPNGGGGRIGRCFANCLVQSEEELAANAHLFAAAPELLDELQKAHQIILNALSLMTSEQKAEWARKNSETRCIGDGTTRFHERAEVIAKATGGAS